MAFSTGNGNAPMAEINVTPLVDVMLVLLIIFIITTPLMTHKVQVELPRADAELDTEEAEKRIGPITVTIKEDGSVYWNDEEVSREMLKSRFATAAQRSPKPPLNLRGDRTTKMRLIDEVASLAQSQGMLDIGFVAVKDRE